MTLESLSWRELVGSELLWLRRLRWAAIAGQLLVFIVAEYGLGLALHSRPLVVLLIFGVVSNLLLPFILRRFRHAGARILGGYLTLDVFLLTGVLFFYGGHTNPFSSMYLAHVVLAAITLPAGWVWLILSLSTVCFAALSVFYVPVPALSLHHGGGPDTFSLHLVGMLWAFVLIGGFLAFVLTRLAVELRERARRIDELRSKAESEKKLLALTSLAATAAHELGTPLATIAVAAHEMARTVRAQGLDAGLLEDAEMIEDELLRCQAIIRSLSARSGEVMGESPEECFVGVLIESALKNLGGLAEERVVWRADAEGALIRTFVESLASTLRALVKNAIEASPRGSPVEVRAEETAGGVSFFVMDRGTGIQEDLVDRVGEPFFTTKSDGLGLGVFLARVFAHRIGGGFAIRPRDGGGSIAILSVPQLPSPT